MSNREVEISRRVKRYRKRLGLSQKEAGEALGLSEVGYGHYDRGRQPFTVEQLFTLSHLLHVPTEELLGLPPPEGMTEEERRLLNDYRTIQHPTVRESTLDFVRHQVELDKKMRGEKQ